MIWLVDANNIFMRQFFKLYVSKHLTNGGAYGFIKFLFTEELPEPKKIICCWDGGRDKRRMEIYPAYKANRNQDVEIKEEQKFQMSIAKEISEEMGIINIQIERVEADDIIASLVMKLYSKKKIAIISSDSDFWQLLEYPNINLYNPKDYKRIKTKNLPVNPEDYVFYKSIVGDTSDNIVGIKGVGPKSMQKYIELKKNNLEHPFVKKITAKINENKEIYLRNLELIDFRKIRNIDKKLIFSNLQNLLSKYTKPNKKEALRKFVKLCDKYNFKSLLNYVDSERFFEWE